MGQNSRRLQLILYTYLTCFVHLCDRFLLTGPDPSCPFDFLPRRPPALAFFPFSEPGGSSSPCEPAAASALSSFHSSSSPSISSGSGP